MAAIRNSISLQDRMTPVFRSIIKSMDSTMRVMRNLDKQANKGVQSKAYQRAQRDIQRANNELIKMQNHLSKADTHANKLAHSTNKVATNMGSINRSGFNLHNLAHGLYLLKNISSILSGMMEIPDSMNAIQYRLDTYDTTKASGAELFDVAYQAAMNSRSDLAGTAGLAARILVSGATNGSGVQAIDLAELLNKASFLGGSSSQESQRALLQLSQALASGVLQGDELRAIREQAPGLTDVLAKGLSSLAQKGLLPEKFLNTTMGDLKALGADGELTADRVIAAFKEMEDYVDETFEKSPKQFGQAMTGIGNVWKRWLKLMSQGDNAFARINDKAWELLEWFESDSGTEFMNNLAAGVNGLVDGILRLGDWIGNTIQWFSDLDNSSQILSSALISLGVVAAAAGLVTFVSWIAATWPILLAIAAVALLVYWLQSLGFTANEVIGALCGGFLFAVYVIWDAILVIILAIAFIVVVVWTVVVAVVSAVIWAIQAIVQLIMWIALTIVNIIYTIYAVIMTIFYGLGIIIDGALMGIVMAFEGLGLAVLSILYGIAAAIDAVFGSSLADTVGGWMEGLDTKVQAVVDDLSAGIDTNVTKTEDLWNNVGYAWGAYDDPEFNITGAMGDTWSNAGTLIGGAWDGFGDINDGLGSVWANPMNGWDAGYGFGSDLTTSIGDFNSSLLDIDGILNDIEKNGLGVNGGDLDSVGSIKSDVDISDEDLKLLRDIAAREFLLNLKTVTPSMSVAFGDVHETADVDKILEVIQDMVDEELATSLVVE